MANIVEKKGKKYNIWDKANQVWNKCSFWTSSDDVDFGDDNATNKLGAINGITSDLSGEADDVAASIKCVNQLNNSLSPIDVPYSLGANVGIVSEIISIKKSGNIVVFSMVLKANSTLNNGVTLLTLKNYLPISRYEVMGRIGVDTVCSINLMASGEIVLNGSNVQSGKEIYLSGSYVIKTN